MDREMDCAKLNSRADDALCEKTCKKQRDCLRHKCGQKCCILFEHPCPLVCGRLLSCGLHRYDYFINIWILDILFSSNHNIHKSLCGLCFWSLDPLIDRFYKKILIKGAEAQKQSPHEL